MKSLLITPDRRALKFTAHPTDQTPRLGASGLANTPLNAADCAERYALPAVMDVSRPKSGLVDAGGMALDSVGAPCADVMQFLADTGGMIGAPSFIGYASCANLSQDPLMRAGVETLAADTTRQWMDVTHPDMVKAKSVKTVIDRMGLRHVFRRAASDTGYFGVARVFIDTGERDQAALREPLRLTSDSVLQGGNLSFIHIDPSLMFPGQYNASDPLSPWFYRPRTWFALGREIHSSRFLHFVQHPVPLLLKPAYNFGGIPSVQMALDYLVHFAGTRESAARLLKKFSLTVFKTNMQSVLYGGGDDDVRRRVEYFAKNRDNDGVELVDMEEEEILQINTPLSGVVDIVRQALEMLAAVWRMPVTKYLGVSPGGMNATGESDLQNWYDHASGQQASMFDEPMNTALALAQLHTFGAIDPDCGFTWAALKKPSDNELAIINKTKADTDAVLQQCGAISAEEIRGRLSNDPQSEYTGLDVDDLPQAPGGELPDDVDGGLL